MAEENFDELVDVVGLKNRVTNGRVTLVRNSRPIVFEPGETKHMPRKIADWLRHKSMFRFNPGDYNEGIAPTWEYKLAIVGDAAHDQTDITKEYVAGVKELLDVSNMPQLTRVDPATGQPLRRVYIDPRSTGAMSNSDSQGRVEREVLKKTSSAIVADAAGKIAEAARGLDEASIGEAVKMVAKDAAGPRNA